MSYAGLRSLLFIVIGAALLVACDDTNLPSAPEPVASVQIEAPASELLVGATLQLAAVPQNAAGEALPGRTVTWSSSDSMVARVSSTGLVTARSAGTAAIRASSEGRDGSVALSVRPLPVPVAAVRIGPRTEVDLRPGMTFPFSATVLAANDSVLDDRPVTWETNNSEVASVSPTGMVTAHTVGTARIAASSGGRGAVATVTVTQSATRLELVHDGVISLYTGDTRQLGVRAFAADGTELLGRTVLWSVADPAIAQITPSGLVRGLAFGSTDVTARVDDATAFVAIDVRSRIVRIDMSATFLTLGTGESFTVTATPRAGDGSILQRTITWASSDPTVATVDANGRVMAHRAGVAAITATAEGQQGYTSLTVLEWGERDLLAIGDSTPPATLYVRTWTDGSGAQRTSRVYATSGSFRMIVTESSRGRYEQWFNVWVQTDDQAPTVGQYVFRGEWQSAAGQLTLRSYGGDVLTGRFELDGRLIVTGRLEAGTPPVTLTYRAP